MSRYDSAGDALYRSYHTRCRYRAEQLWPGWYVERRTSAIVISGFSSYEAAWPGSPTSWMHATKTHKNFARA
jgi:hypothetical protein